MASQPSSAPKWDFDRHCTNQLPDKILTMQDLGHENDDSFGVTAPFTVLTEECIKIARDIILNDQKVRKHCKFNDCDHKMTDNSYAFRNVCGINPFFKGMLSCPRFEDYLQRCCRTKEISLWTVDWLKGHANVQEGKEDEDIPNVAWHYDQAPFAMLINLSEMPENPKGGGSLLKNKNGEIIPMIYKKAGDSIVIRGSRIQHCGLGAQNYNKILLAPGLGNGDVRIPDVNNDFNHMHWNNSEPVNFMEQWTDYRLNRMNEQLDILVEAKDEDSKEKLLKNMKKEMKVMRRSFDTFYTGIRPADTPWGKI